MDDDDAPTQGPVTLSRNARWRVYQCANGCVHVHLQNVTLTLRTEEFAQLVQLVGDAYVRLGVRTAISAIRPH
jgi:hypothetical protein